MVGPLTSVRRAARWQQPLAIIVVLGWMLMARTPAAPAAPAAPTTQCVDLDSLPTQAVGNGEKIVHLGNATVGHQVTLCPRSNSVRRVRFKVRQSNVLLDCGGVVFDGSAGPEGAAVSRAIDFDVNVSPAIHDVVVRNCEFHDYARGIKVVGTNIQGAPDEGLANITLQDTILRDIDGTAVTIGAHNRDNLLERVEITRSRLTGVYLEAHSSRTTVRGCRFIDNGWSKSPEGREAIAIDASSHNLIMDSVFENNKYAGIALYKNCGESNTPRTVGANYNTIERNSFFHHDNALAGAAIVIASRQGMDPNTPGDAFSGTCTDAPALGNRYRDIARHNVVRRNAFIDNVTAIRVRDSFNRIEGNTFVGDTWTDPDDEKTERAQHDVVVSADLLEAIGEPATGITLTDNVHLDQNQ